MYTVIVIDDEKTIRKGLIGYIDWKSLNCRIIGDFENGIQAIDYLKSHQVDIIISDIKMPGADGLEVAKFVYECCPYSKTILYTGYSDFEYAKSAIKYNVSDFIIKPSTMENIVQTIKQTTHKINKQREQDHRITTLESKINDVNSKVHLNVLKDYVKGIKVDPSTLEETLKYHQIHMERFCLLLYRINSIKPFNHSQTIQFINLSLNDLDQYTFLLNDNTYGSLISLDKKLNSKPMNLLKSKCMEINDFVRDFIKGKIYIGISNIHENFTYAPTAFMEAQRCLDSSFYNDHKSLTIFSEFSGPIENPTFTELNLEKISLCISKKREAEAIHTIKKMFNNMCENKEPITYIKSMGIAVYTICMNVLNRYNLSSDDIFNDYEPYQQIIQSTNMNDLIDVLCDMVNQVILYQSEGTNNYLIQKANDYMKEHFAKPIRLNDIASHIHVNSSYLSRLYKDKTGQTITSVLRKIRVEEAKILLREGHIKTYEIATKVGFEDPAYFSYVFKQETDFSPSQYKNKF